MPTPATMPALLARARQIDALMEDTYLTDAEHDVLIAEARQIVESVYELRKAELAAEAARLAADPPALPAPPDRPLL